MRSIRFITLLLVIALIAAACSSDSNDTTTTTTAVAETTTTTEAAETAATAIATETTTTTEPVEPEDLTGPLGLVLIPNGIDDNPICGYDGDEIVTPAPIDIVRQAFEELGIDAAVGPLVRDPVRDIPYELPGGLNAYVLAALDPGSSVPSPVDVSAALLTVGIPASPRHLVMPAARWKFGPANDAVAAAPGDYVQSQIMNASGEAVVDGGTIAVIDTGSTPSPPVHPDGNWDGIFTGPGTAALQSAGSEPPDLDLNLAGHGVFVTGIVRRLAPGANVSIGSAMYNVSPGGAIFDEHSVVEVIKGTLGFDLREGGVVNLSLGTYVCEPNQIPLELAVFLGNIAASTEFPDTDVVFVAAAGNDDEGEHGSPFWPASFADSHLVATATEQWNLDAMDSWPADSDEQLATIAAFRDSMDALMSTPIVIGVGALKTGFTDRATFSNQLGATVWAPGTDIVSTYPDWILSNRPDWNANNYGSSVSTGFASWSGTSFAAPFVSAMVAGCRSTTKSGTYRESLSLFVSNPPMMLTDPICP